ncbi:hypothetical protein DFR58_11266 [Anaerobacterium chartisolvens]|uniref:Uncharacterized protein n=2 Tax=Anaerobacterium chartisolvens TaxID=1297424 RepID=A0A369B8U0_9FIRM|nr:hypothetical protein DFR58_11266 [Anaerobacterium chartisolvens]
MELIVTIGIALLEYLLLEKFIGLRSQLKKVINNSLIYLFVVIFIAVILYYIFNLLFSKNEYYYLISKIPMGTMVFLLLSDFKKLIKK